MSRERREGLKGLSALAGVPSPASREPRGEVILDMSPSEGTLVTTGEAAPSEREAGRRLLQVTAAAAGTPRLAPR